MNFLWLSGDLQKAEHNKEALTQHDSAPIQHSTNIYDLKKFQKINKGSIFFDGLHFSVAHI